MSKPKPRPHLRRRCADCKKLYSEWRMWQIDGAWYCQPTCFVNERDAALIVPPELPTSHGGTNTAADWSG